MPTVAIITTDPKLSPQPSLWDTLIRRPARVSRRARRVAQATTQPPASPSPSVPIASQPLRVGPPWPPSDVTLVVEGDTAGRRFSFRRALWCGARCYVLLSPWESRDDALAALCSVGIERVRIE